MGFVPDMVRASTDEVYAARVFQDHIQTGNVSIFDRSVFYQVTAPHYSAVHTWTADEVLVDNVIEEWNIVDRVYRALQDLVCHWWEKGLIGEWHLALETFDEVKAEYDALDEWLADSE